MKSFKRTLLAATIASVATTQAFAAAQYDGSKDYVGGAEVCFDGGLYKAQWWASSKQSPAAVSTVANRWDSPWILTQSSSSTCANTSDNDTAVIDESANNGSDDPQEQSVATDAAGYVSGSTYQKGDKISHQGRVFVCDVAGWCNQTGADWAYEPGKGLYWDNAWNEVGASDASGTDTVVDAGTDSSTGSNTDTTVVVGTDSNTNTTVDTGTDSNTDTTVDAGTDTTADAGTDANTDSTVDAGTDANTDTTADAGTDNNVDSGSSNMGDTGNDTVVDNGDNAADNSDASFDKVVATYFVEWGIYGRDYHVMDLPAEKLTHVLYGFIPICGPNDSLKQANASGYSALVQQCADKEDYEVVVHDKYAALEKTYPGDKWDDPIKGNFGQIAKLKQQYPHLKFVPSIGGWTLSDPFFTMAQDADKRAVFVKSAVQFLRDYAMFDGIDIDWEFPGGGGSNSALGGSSDYQAYADLMRDLRAGLDTLEAETGRDYELTSAIGAGPAKIDSVNYREAQMHMDYIFNMNYDFYGAWSSEVGHQTALYDYAENKHAGYNAAESMFRLIEAGVPAEKLVMGVAAYGRGWKNVQVGADNNILMGTAGGAADGTWEAGVLDYKDIADNYLGGTQGTGINGFTYHYDEMAEAAYVFNPSTGVLISYDNPRSVTAKGEFVKKHNLGGVFSWEIDGDNGDVLDAMYQSMRE